jgi:hypothetical protein
MSLDHYSEFVECLENIWYLNTYNLSSCFTVANCLAIAVDVAFKLGMKFSEDREEAD